MAEVLRRHTSGEIDVPVRFLSIEPMIGPVDEVSLQGIAWVIVGGESGPRRRPMDPNWVRDVRDRCTAEGLRFFFKQWHKKRTGRLLDGRTWDEMPEVGAGGKSHRSSLRQADGSLAPGSILIGFAGRFAGIASLRHPSKAEAMCGREGFLLAARSEAGTRVQL